MFKKLVSIPLAMAFIALAGVLKFIYNQIGSSVNEQGVLQESFALIPLSWLCLVIGIVIIAARLWCYMRNKSSK